MRGVLEYSFNGLEGMDRQGHTWPDVSGFRNHYSDMQGAFFHFTCQIQGCCHDKIRIRPPYFHLDIIPSNIHMRCRNRLLPYRHRFTQLDQFCVCHTSLVSFTKTFSRMPAAHLAEWMKSKKGKREERTGVKKNTQMQALRQRKLLH